MPFFSKVFKGKDVSASKASLSVDGPTSGSINPLRSAWEDAWKRTEVSPNEVQELIHICTQELKSRGMHRSQKEVVSRDGF